MIAPARLGFPEFEQKSDGGHDLHAHLRPAGRSQRLVRGLRCGHGRSQGGGTQSKQTRAYLVYSNFLVVLVFFYNVLANFLRVDLIGSSNTHVFVFCFYNRFSPLCGFVFAILVLYDMFLRLVLSFDRTTILFFFQLRSFLLFLCYSSTVYIVWAPVAAFPVPVPVGAAVGVVIVPFFAHFGF